MKQKSISFRFYVLKDGKPRFTYHIAKLIQRGWFAFNMPLDGPMSTLAALFAVSLATFVFFILFFGLFALIIAFNQIIITLLGVGFMLAIFLIIGAIIKAVPTSKVSSEDAFPELFAGEKYLFGSQKGTNKLFVKNIGLIEYLFDANSRFAANQKYSF